MRKSKATSKQFNFATAVRMTVDELQQNGEITTDMVVDEMKSRYPEVIERHVDAFINQAVASAARRCMKTTIDLIEDENGQYSLKINDITVPKSVSLPPPRGESKNVWTRIETATYRQLKTHIQLLERSIDHDNSKLRQMQLLEASLRPYMTQRSKDEPIKPWLIMLSEKVA